MSLTQYSNNMGTCKMHNEIETNQAKLMETKRNETENRNETKPTKRNESKKRN